MVLAENNEYNIRREPINSAGCFSEKHSFCVFCFVDYYYGGRNFIKVFFKRHFWKRCGADRGKQRNLGYSSNVVSLQSVFEAMFMGEFKEKHLEKIPLPGKKFSDMLEFVECLIPCPVVKPITMVNVFILMPLADEYAIEDLKVRIEIFFKLHMKKLAETEGVAVDSFIEMLIPCARYKLNNVVEKCIIVLARRYSTAELKSIYSSDLPLSVLALILELKLQNVVKFCTEQQCPRCKTKVTTRQLRGHCCGNHFALSTSSNFYDDIKVNTELFKKFKST